MQGDPCGISVSGRIPEKCKQKGMREKDTALPTSRTVRPLRVRFTAILFSHACITSNTEKESVFQLIS
ncbi:hypothetical protein BBEV_0548 [Salisediminibacterium beveridgei]|uniref:Uncharacterized protein n=1 Tax=Salisediminibacterium beveridgei TaxID=632773 RepID=A0A1D7QSI5_9BACI|nr:hypothetical protein BBEV_0548 [Salisediminibacterium beveridgei]